MLSRTADHLFWMARYMERAENTARMLDVNYQMALLPQSAEEAEQGWRSLLGISELTAGFSERYPQVTGRHVMDFMVRDAANASSIVACVRAARENARARHRLTAHFQREDARAFWQTQRFHIHGDEDLVLRHFRHLLGSHDGW